MYHALLCIRSTQTISGGMLNLYTIGSPFHYTNINLIGGEDSDPANPRILHVYNSNDSIYKVTIPYFVKVPSFRHTQEMQYTYNPSDHTYVIHQNSESLKAQCATYLADSLLNDIFRDKDRKYHYHASHILLYIRFGIRQSIHMHLYLSAVYNLLIKEMQKSANMYLHGVLYDVANNCVKLTKLEIAYISPNYHFIPWDKSGGIVYGLIELNNTYYIMQDINITPHIYIYSLSDNAPHPFLKLTESLPLLSKPRNYMSTQKYPCIFLYVHPDKPPQDGGRKKTRKQIKKKS
jgi:hypothetical protein